jgi:hypothetical protein
MILTGFAAALPGVTLVIATPGLAHHAESDRG